MHCFSMVYKFLPLYDKPYNTLNKSIFLLKHSTV